MGEPLKWWDKPTVLCGTLTAELVPRKTSTSSLNFNMQKSPRKFVSPDSFFILNSIWSPVLREESLFELF